MYHEWRIPLLLYSLEADGTGAKWNYHFLLGVCGTENHANECLRDKRLIFVGDVQLTAQKTYKYNYMLFLFVCKKGFNLH